MLSQRKMLDSIGDQNLPFSQPKYTWSKRSRVSLRSLHTLETIGYSIM